VVTVSATVTNTGDRSGDEVLQMYVRDVAASMVRPVRQLGGFRRVTVERGASVRVHFDYDTSQLAFLNARNQLVVEAGDIDVMVGSSSADLPLQSQFTLTSTIELAHRTSFVTPSRLS
jgi:beta-glucosidase